MSKTTLANGVNIDDLDAFSLAYLECALWSTFTGAGDPLDEFYSITDIDAESVNKMIEDCRNFQKDNAALLEKTYKTCKIAEGGNPQSHAGHDFWLTRNGHGCGFWDGDYPDGGEELTEICKQKWPEQDLLEMNDESLRIE